MNGAHLKKMASADEIAAAVGVDVRTCAAERSPRPSTRAGPWTWTGISRHCRRARRRSSSSTRDLRPASRKTTGRSPGTNGSRALNDQFIKAVSDWQKTDGDPKAESRSHQIVERLIKALDDITAVDPALRALRAPVSPTALRGSIEANATYVCGPTINSVHTIWFEFHEDILSVLGRPRDV